MDRDTVLVICCVLAGSVALAHIAYDFVANDRAGAYYAILTDWRVHLTIVICVLIRLLTRCWKNRGGQVESEDDGDDGHAGVNGYETDDEGGGSSSSSARSSGGSNGPGGDTASDSNDSSVPTPPSPAQAVIPQIIDDSDLDNYDFGVVESDDEVLLPPARRSVYSHYNLTMTPIRPKRALLVTIGSIASFSSLIEEILSDRVLKTLKELKYTHLYVQYGPDAELFASLVNAPGFDDHGIKIEGFGYTDNMAKYTKFCTPDHLIPRAMGLIIAHPGAGTLVEVLNLETKTVVVPNNTLMDDHQTELAAELDAKHSAVFGVTGKLSEAIKEAETFTPAQWPPIEAGDNRNAGGLAELVNSVVEA